METKKDVMQKEPSLSGNRDRQRRDAGYEPRQGSEYGASLWLAITSVLIALAAMAYFGQDNVTNGGAPFVISPPAQISNAPLKGY